MYRQSISHVSASRHAKNAHQSIAIIVPATRGDTVEIGLAASFQTAQGGIEAIGLDSAVARVDL